jgi:hypothetical protein
MTLPQSSGDGRDMLTARLLFLEYTGDVKHRHFGYK